jgi:hypothetical protein
MVRAVAAAVKRVATAGLHDQALAAARALEDDASRAQALAAVAGALADAGLHDRAIEIARTIQHDASRAQALAAVAGKLTKTVGIGQATTPVATVVNQALSLSSITNRQALFQLLESEAPLFVSLASKREIDSFPSVLLETERWCAGL